MSVRRASCSGHPVQQSHNEQRRYSVADPRSAQIAADAAKAAAAAEAKAQPAQPQHNQDLTICFSKIDSSITVEGQQFNIRFFKAVNGCIVYSIPTKDQQTQLKQLLKSTIEAEKKKDPSGDAFKAMQKVVIQWPLDDNNTLNHEATPEVIITDQHGAQKKYEIDNARDWGAFMQKHPFSKIQFMPSPHSDTAAEQPDAPAGTLPVSSNRGSPNSGTDCFFNAAMHMLAGTQLHEQLKLDEQTYHDLLIVLNKFDEQRINPDIVVITPEELGTARTFVESLLPLVQQPDIQGQSDPSVVFEALAESLGEKSLGMDTTIIHHIKCPEPKTTQPVSTNGHYAIPLLKKGNLNTHILAFQITVPNDVKHYCGHAKCTIIYHKFAPLDDYIFSVKRPQQDGRVKRQEIIAPRQMTIADNNCDLVGYTIHKGPKANSGHYVARVKIIPAGGGTPGYYEFDDNKRKPPLTEEEFFEGAGQAYQYHYKRAAPV